MPTGTVYVDGQFKAERGQNVIVVGRVLLGVNATINPRDLNLRTIRSINFNPWQRYDVFVAGSIGSTTSKHYFREFRTMIGSIGSLGVLDASTSDTAPVGNYVRVRSYRVRTFGSITNRSASAQGTKGIYIGTVAGSQRASFVAVGM